MAVLIKEGNIFDSECQTLVCPVNCVGIMGAGLAKQFKDYYPEMEAEYRPICHKHLLKIGMLWIWNNTRKYTMGMEKILCFPTKIHWNRGSEMYYLYLGLEKFVKTYQEKGITSIAFPLLGCGKGGLKQEDVLPVMWQFLDPLPIPVEIWIPSENPLKSLYMI